MDKELLTQYLAFDLGASSGRAVLGTLKNGRMDMAVVHRFKTPVVEEDGHLFWDLELLWAEMLTGFQKAHETAPALRSVSVDSWAVDYVRLDVDGKAIANPFTYRDSRLDGVMESAFATVSRDEIYRITGIQFLPFNTLFQVIADKHARGAADSVSSRHANDAATAVRMCIADYFNNRFLTMSDTASLKDAAIDVTMASTTQMMDVHNQMWSGSLMKRFDVDDGTWPRIVPAGTVLGKVAGHESVTVLATCSHDTGAAVAATPASNDRSWAFVSCGTWSLFGVELQKPHVNEASLAAGFTNEAGLDGTIRFLKNLTGFWILQECTRMWSEQDGSPVDVGELMKQAEQSAFAGSHIDMQDGRFLARGNMPLTLAAYFDEMGLTHPKDRGEMVRLIVESMAESYRITASEIEHLTGETIETLHLFGGGSQSALLCQLAANACGIRVVAGPAEATALGNLLVQARTMGDLATGKTIRDVSIHSSELKVYEPAGPAPTGTNRILSEQNNSK